jgi:hypothetical protein
MLILVTLAVLFGKSCISYTPVEPDQEKTQVTSHTIGFVGSPILILDVLYEGHQHEMLYFSNGLDHWPSCKYCSEEPSEQNPVPERQELKPLKQMEKRDLQVIRKLTITPSGK